MSKTGRNDPCPCGSGKKYKKCCAFKHEAERRGVLPDTAGAFITNAPADKPFPHADASWPIERAYVPVADVWRATGLGLAGVVRRQPNGLLTQVLFTISLLDRGLESIIGKCDMQEGEPESFLESIRQDLFPFEDGPAAVASQFIWGAREMSESHGVGFPPDQSLPYLASVPQPPGTRRDWLETFSGAGCLSPRPLIELIRHMPSPEVAGERMELAVRTTLDFKLDNPASMLARLSSSSPNARGFRFILAEPVDQQGACCFHWARPVPPGTRSMAPVRDGLQIQAGLELRDDNLSVVGLSLSMVARLVSDLKNEFGASIKLVGAEWEDPNRLAEPLPGSMRERLAAWLRPDGLTRNSGARRFSS